MLELPFGGCLILRCSRTVARKRPRRMVESDHAAKRGAFSSHSPITTFKRTTLRNETAEPPSEATDAFWQPAVDEVLVTVSRTPEPARSDSGDRLPAKSSRDRPRDETEQSSGLRCGAETYLRAFETTSLQQDGSVGRTLVESTRKEVGCDLLRLAPLCA